MNNTTEAAANATLTSVFAFFVTFLGVEPQAIVWSFVGCILGVTLAKPSGRFYAIILFLAATLACSLLATITADAFFSNGRIARNTCAVIYGAAFHPLLSAFIGSIPGFVDAFRNFIVKRFLGGQ